MNWGSQFPTKWGPGGKSRYLDALLRDGSTPWAIEMKVQGGAGVGQYYRHAVAQAVLYREFIRRADATALRGSRLESLTPPAVRLPSSYPA